jgi:hypothetical protein
MLGSPGKIDLSSEKLLDLPDLEKGKPGPALTAPNTQDDKAGGESAAKKTPLDQSQTEPAKTGNATDDPSKTESTKQSDIKESETKESAPQKESEKNPASGAQKPDDKSAVAPNDGAKGSDNPAAKDEPKGGQPDAKSPNGG